MPRLQHCTVLALWILSTPLFAFDHVVFISVDGLRADAISEKATPTIQRLLNRAIYTLQANAVVPSRTMPNHTSMLTGLSPKQHGVTWNHQRLDSYRGQTVFTMLKGKGMSTAAFVAKLKLGFLLGAADWTHIEAKQTPDQLMAGISARNITQLFVDKWNSEPASFTFVHLREPDSSGHEYEWMSDEYFSAVVMTDTAVGTMVETIYASSVAKKTAILITSDHGGSGSHHDADLPENWIIPWIVVLPEVHHPVVIKSSVKAYDALPTILALLGVDLDGPISGRVPAEVLEAIE